MRDITQMTCGHPDLADDFGGAEIAVEALGTGHAEAAVHGATDLAGNAQGTAPLVGDEHGLDGVGAIHAQQPLVGAIHGGLVEDHLGRHHFGPLLQLDSQVLAQIGHGFEVIDVPVVDPLHHLVRTKALLAELLDEETFQPDAIKPKQIQFGTSFLHGNQRGQRSVEAKK